jgi:hypothetical protein
VHGLCSVLGIVCIFGGAVLAQGCCGFRAVRCTRRRRTRWRGSLWRSRRCGHKATLQRAPAHARARPHVNTKTTLARAHAHTCRHTHTRSRAHAHTLAKHSRACTHARSHTQPRTHAETRTHAGRQTRAAETHAQVLTQIEARLLYFVDKFELEAVKQEARHIADCVKVRGLRTHAHMRARTRTHAHARTQRTRARTSGTAHTHTRAPSWSWAQACTWRPAMLGHARTHAVSARARAHKRTRPLWFGLL